MKAQSVFVGLLKCPDGHHDAFLDWHEYDHRPENHGVIEHVFHSARYVASPEDLMSRETAAEGPFADAGQYVMTYWSSASPTQLLDDMTVVREQLNALGRCEPINRDFTATWRDRLQVVKGYASPHHLASAAAVPLAPHDTLVVTVGRHAAGDAQAWSRWYDREGVAQVFSDKHFTGAFTLVPMEVGDRLLFLHLHFALGPAHDACAALRGTMQPGPEILFRGAFTPQHAGHPRFYS